LNEREKLTSLSLSDSVLISSSSCRSLIAYWTEKQSQKKSWRIIL